MGKVSRSVRKSQSCDKEASTSLQCVASKRSISIKNSNAKEECVIWVVNVESLSNADDASPEDKSVQAAVFRKLESSCLAPRWIDEEDCLKILRKGNEIFVLPTFCGRLFDHLSAVGCRTYGSLAVLSCLNAGERLPKWTHPIQSVTLKDAVICFTGVDHAVREVQTALILRMGGVVSRDFNTAVTHLVALEHNTSLKKYGQFLSYFRLFKAAVERSIPIMSLEWLKKAWEAAKKFNEIRFTDKDIVELYRLKLFTGCVSFYSYHLVTELMTCSGVSLQERLLLGQLIEENGGRFKGDMERYKCTHLLTNLNTGEKYRNAREWGWKTIKIVRVGWLAKCIEKGYRIPEHLYEPKLPIKCSTPKNSQPMHSAGLEVSAIPGPKARLCDIMGQNTSTLHSTRSDIHEENQISNIAMVIDQSSVEEVLKKNVSSRVVEDAYDDDPIDCVNFSHLDTDDFLEGCRIFFVGFEKIRLAKWKRLANALGASVSSVYNDTVTHVVVFNSKPDLKTVSEPDIVSSSCTVVRCEWLVECAKAHRLVSTSNFIKDLSDSQNINQSENKASKNLPIVFHGSQNPGIDAALRPSLGDHQINITPSTSNIPTAESVPTILSKDLTEVDSLMNNCIELLRSDNCEASSGSGNNSPLVDSPSAFLNPKKNFIPHFDLRQAYEFVDGLQSFEQPSNSPETFSWSESAVGKVLGEAIEKTSRKDGKNGERRDDVLLSGDWRRTECGNEKSFLETPVTTGFNEKKLNTDRSREVTENEIAVLNEEKTRLIERCLANLANCEDGRPSSSFLAKSRKRPVCQEANEPVSKSEAEKIGPSSLLCDFHDSAVGGGIIGWEEAQPSVKQVRYGPTNFGESSDRNPSTGREDVVTRRKKGSFKFGRGDDILFIERQADSQKISVAVLKELSGGCADDFGRCNDLGYSSVPTNCVTKEVGDLEETAQQSSVLAGRFVTFFL
ncbi:unnamed protein product [Enterobius vermicularis]|uniref:DNA topoisomerase 2-binding protein 1 n=1 Tax=Enterobius vermicularis TaxID=51028 RepID=A0A0N4VBY6_ENTVE|nr:unnamed protein product [Enterobius vermicularis]